MTSIRHGVLAAVIAGFISSPAFADCDSPELPASTPEPDKATVEELKALQPLAVKANGMLEGYDKCIKKMEAGLTPESTDEDKAVVQAHIDRYNATIDFLNKFNEMIRAYKARSAAAAGN